MNVIARAWKAWRQSRRDRRLLERLSRIGGPEDIFTTYYRTNRWGSVESKSGFGSTAEYTENLRRELPPLFARLGTRTILDAPCGDYNWFRLVDRPGVAYVGGDIVKPLVDENNLMYGNADTRFLQLDITRDPLPAADLWLCRDVLFHLSYEDALRALRNFVASDIPHLLTTTHPECTDNRDIPTGSFRLLNMGLAPFGFPPPQVAIEDWIEGFPVRYLGLWPREAIAAALSRS